jgi:hypothetical protein
MAKVLFLDKTQIFRGFKMILIYEMHERAARAVFVVSPE